MDQFNEIHETENNFVKSNPHFLKSMFGVTEAMPLWIADMDFKVAEAITTQLQKIVDRGIYAYEFSSSKAIHAITSWNAKRHRLALDKKAFIQVSGVLTGISILIRDLTDEGDGIVVQDPVYHQFSKVIKSAGRNVVSNPLKVIDEYYQMDFDDLENKLKSKTTKTILICNPHNPVGRVWKKEELLRLVQLANTYGATIISDEIHSDIVYSNATFNSITSVDDSENHIAILGSPAKTFGMQSISNGYLYIPNQKTHEQIKKVIAAMYLDHGNTFSEYATIAAYSHGEEWLDQLITYLEETVRWVIDYVEKELPQVKLFKPEGTYQLWLDFSELNLSEEALGELITQKARLALTPGSWFADSHGQFMRMNIASPLSKIQQACFELKKAIEE